MQVGQKSINEKWNLISEVNNGQTFLIQALNGEVEYMVSSTQPKETDGGGILPKKSQLQFLKVGGDLYLRKYGSNAGTVKINIEEKE